MTATSIPMDLQYDDELGMKKWVDEMIEMRNEKIAILMIVLMLLSGCTGSDSGGGSDVQDEVDGSMDPVEGENETDSGDIVPLVISVPHSVGCDSLDPGHCMMPFPSSKYLADDSSTNTGFRLNVPAAAIPVSGSAGPSEIPMLGLFDGHSPSTQIFTTFTDTPDISSLADQLSIGSSISEGHGSILLNMDNGEILPHWVEIDERSQDDEPTIVFLRTIGGLEHDAQYAVAFRGLVDNSGEAVESHASFAALRDGHATDDPDLEARRDSYEPMFSALSDVGFERSEIQSAWWFHTASTESIIGDVITMRDDALERLGDDGIGCNVTEVNDNWGDDGMTFRRIKGTFTAPQYVEADFPPTLLRRDQSGTPLFVENREVVFTITIPQSLANSSTSGPLTVMGHGFLGNGDGMVSGGLREWGELFGTPMIGTDFKGWSSDGDYDAVTFALMNVEYFQHQAERLMQSMMNNVAMVRTFSGVCSDLAEFHHNGTNLIDVSDIGYMGYSLGGLRGPSMLATTPGMDRGVLWVGGSSFTHQVERSTQYTQFEELFANEIAYPSRNDRAVLIAQMQSMWDTTDAESYLPFIEEGFEGKTQPFEVLYISSVNDAQVTILSTDRAVRTAGLSNLNSSAWHPWGIDVSSTAIEGSGVAYFDGGFPDVPSGNIQGPMEYHSLAHNQIAAFEPAYTMAFDYLFTGTVSNTCGVSCTFEGVW